MVLIAKYVIPNGNPRQIRQNSVNQLFFYIFSIFFIIWFFFLVKEICTCHFPITQDYVASHMKGNHITIVHMIQIYLSLPRRKKINAYASKNSYKTLICFQLLQTYYSFSKLVSVAMDSIATYLRTYLVYYSIYFNFLLKFSQCKWLNNLQQNTIIDRQSQYLNTCSLNFKHPASNLEDTKKQKWSTRVGRQCGDSGPQLEYLTGLLLKFLGFWVFGWW